MREELNGLEAPNAWKRKRPRERLSFLAVTRRGPKGNEILRPVAHFVLASMLVLEAYT